MTAVRGTISEILSLWTGTTPGGRSALGRRPTRARRTCKVFGVLSDNPATLDHAFAERLTVRTSSMPVKPMP